MFGLVPLVLFWLAWTGLEVGLIWFGSPLFDDFAFRLVLSWVGLFLGSICNKRKA
jgi:hypothetical protein